MPVHSELQKAGFVDYLQMQLKAGFVRPFESQWKAWTDKKTGGIKWSHYVSKWGGGELARLTKARKIDRTDLELSYFHSMRHTFAQVLKRSGVDEESRAALQGHQFGASENGKRYADMRNNHQFLLGIVEEELGELTALLP